MNNDLFIKQISLDRSKIEDFSVYPFNIECVRNFKTITFNKNVSFFIGDNGIGKSTFIEALAYKLKLNSEGGTQNFNFKTKDTISCLHNYLKLYRNGLVPKTRFFLRAESFYNFATELQRLVEEDRFYVLYPKYGGNLHECSHGESFIKLIKNRFTDHGLYILDEPEAALSPMSQLSLLCLINDLANQGSQFIIATHSPILISYRDGEIFNLNDDFAKIEYKDTEIYSIYKMYLDDPFDMQRRLFDSNEII